MKAFKLFFVLFFLAVFGLAACGREGATAGLPTEAPAEPVVEAASSEAASESPATDGAIACPPSDGAKEISDAKLIVEYNSTDGDIGVHGSFDDDGWSVLCVYDPNGNQVLGVKPESQLGKLTVGSLFFESREPPVDEFSFADLTANFPEGEYEVRGRSFEGESLSGAATFSHNFPAPPIITTPELAEDEESAGDVVINRDNLVVSWEEVTKTVDGDPANITGYEVIVTKVEHEDPHGFSRPVYDVHVPPDVVSLMVPAEFLEPDTVYELEVLALEESGNQTITVGFFQSAGEST